MAIELANEKWLDGDEAGLLGQFASTNGYSNLMIAAENDPVLSEFFNKGVTEDVPAVLAALVKFKLTAAPDIASTADALFDLMLDQDFVIITNGGN